MQGRRVLEGLCTDLSRYYCNFLCFSIYKLPSSPDIRLLTALHVSNNVNKTFVVEQTARKHSFDFLLLFFLEIRNSRHLFGHLKVVCFSNIRIIRFEKRRYWSAPTGTGDPCRLYGCELATMYIYKAIISKFYGIFEDRLWQVPQFFSLSWIILRGGHC